MYRNPYNPASTRFPNPEAPTVTIQPGISAGKSPTLALSIHADCTEFRSAACKTVSLHRYLLRPMWRPAFLVRLQEVDTVLLETSLGYNLRHHGINELATLNPGFSLNVCLCLESTANTASYITQEKHSRYSPILISYITETDGRVGLSRLYRIGESNSKNVQLRLILIIQQPCGSSYDNEVSSLKP